MTRLPPLSATLPLGQKTGTLVHPGVMKEELCQLTGKP